MTPRNFPEVLMRAFSLVAALLVIASTAAAQDFAPPTEDTSPPTTVKFGIFGFSSRLGVDFKGPNQAIASMAVEVADIYSGRVRLRPSIEIGAGGGAATYVGNVELMYRFTPDTERAVPYIAFGLGLYGEGGGAVGCGPASGCPKLMPQFALGFELKFRSNMNWVVEYHGEDALRRHRFFVGLTTRRG
ncbi:MAG: hypothetical protein EXR93_03400 [Gemmatimonadetes bacterium]|nr:hypothetical protein [Gemmatimonadota bacterium]